MIENAILIAGPTASGKSRLALEAARRLGGVVINADSMQVYGGLRVLTARPRDDELALVPHLLYGHVNPAEAYSTGRYLRDVADLAADRRPLVFAGGTGLYFRALLQGLSQMPAVPPAIRERWRERLAREGAGALHAILARSDPATARRLSPSDGQRIVRALEVGEAAGLPISALQAGTGEGLVDRASARLIIIEPPRKDLVARIEDRFDAMMEEGAVEEVEALMARGLAPDLPAMKAIGVREIAACLAGDLTRKDAMERAKAATRQYSKRQSTWFRNQFGAGWSRFAGADEALRELAERKPAKVASEPSG